MDGLHKVEDLGWVNHSITAIRRWPGQSKSDTQPLNSGFNANRRVLQTYAEGSPPVAMVLLVCSNVSFGLADWTETYFQKWGQKFLANVWAGGGRIGANGTDTNFDVSITFYETTHVEMCQIELVAQTVKLSDLRGGVEEDIENDVEEDEEDEEEED